MSSLLKDIYNPSFYQKIVPSFGEVIPNFDSEKFIALIFSEDWEKKELKERMKHTSLVLNNFFPADFDTTADLIIQLIGRLQENGITGHALEFMFLPDYIETFGIHDFNSSVKAFEVLTPFSSCEFAVRPYIIRYGDKMLNKMLEWSQHSNHHVRRLSSEGSRPRLPWAIALPDLKKDPSPTLPILENLKNDSSEYVRKSVSNHINDIAKDHPDIVVGLVKNWRNQSKETDALLKHGSRTLLKQGHAQLLSCFGIDKAHNIEISAFELHDPMLKIGESLSFSFTLLNNDPKTHDIRLEYAIYYLRQNGTHAKKVFKISERTLATNESLSMHRKQSFKIITTRKFYPGTHQLSLIINGQEMEFKAFELEE